MEKVFVEQECSDDRTKDSFWVIVFKPSNVHLHNYNVT